MFVLQSPTAGRSDPAAVVQMIDLQANTQSLERNQPPPAAATAKARKKTKNQSDHEEKICSAHHCVTLCQHSCAQ